MSICGQLHNIVRQGKKFSFPINYADLPNNGIYILFQKGEKGHDGDRIVRIGTDTGGNQLRSRIQQHFENENKNRSIFRKHIGRCLLNERHSEYLPIWEYDTTSRAGKTKYGHLVDLSFEHSLEKEISQFIQQNFYFVLLSVPTKESRIYFEARLIGTVSNCRECKPSPFWLGLQSTKQQIVESGLWQIQKLYSQPLTVNELKEVEKMLVRQ